MNVAIELNSSSLYFVVFVALTRLRGGLQIIPFIEGRVLSSNSDPPIQVSIRTV